MGRLSFGLEKQSAHFYARTVTEVTRPSLGGTCCMYPFVEGDS